MNFFQTTAEREQILLASYAMHSAESTGREYPESEHLYRGPYQRDRDRVLHSAAYRRLADKTQVFTGHMGDYHRTRLTHTLEVASIARTIGRALRLNEDLIEALALLHDIGHPPFGHAGEDALDECLSGEGGFSHNAYALCLIRELEIRYADFPGLNLTREVLAGQLARAQKQTGPSPILEVQVVDLADSITYDSHDTDDAMELGLVTLHELRETCLVAEVVDRVLERNDGLQGRVLRKSVVHELIDWQVGDVLDHCGTWLREHRPASAAAVHAAGFHLGVGRALEEKKGELEAFLHEQVYRHEKLIQQRKQAQSQLREMFLGFQRNPHWLPKRFQQRADQIGLKRSVADYIAGMTDRYCQQQYQRLFASNAGGSSVETVC